MNVVVVRVFAGEDEGDDGEERGGGSGGRVKAMVGLGWRWCGGGGFRLEVVQRWWVSRWKFVDMAGCFRVEVCSHGGGGGSDKISGDKVNFCCLLF
ncbi:hypothetical protein Hanom_Chr03g00196761 [Helianthus anomalus]